MSNLRERSRGGSSLVERLIAIICGVISVDGDDADESNKMMQRRWAEECGS